MNLKTFLTAICLATFSSTFAQLVTVYSPDSLLSVVVDCNRSGQPQFSATYKGVPMLESSPLGLRTNNGNYVDSMKLVDVQTRQIDKTYKQSKIKTSEVQYKANEAICTFVNPSGQRMDITFNVSSNDVAFRYSLPREFDKASVTIFQEETGFRFPQQTTSFLTPQCDPMIGWKRTKPSYEEEYVVDAALTSPSLYGQGYTFPCLFRIGEDGWVLLSETGVSSRYCGSRLGEYTNGVFPLAFPMEGENNGNGSVAPAMALPGSTPWRTLTIGDTLQPIAETTIAWDVVDPLYESEHNYKMGKGTWSWILWQDESINYEDLQKFIDLSAAMGFEYTLIDNWWDKNIGKERMGQLIKEAQAKNVDVFLWYSSSGYWNDIEQGPVNMMDDPIIRKREMKWLQSQGVKGIKVDFFGGDKQETMRLYEAILSDADDHGLMVIFHGCTIPRGWERMYPNYVGSEAVLASENMVFNQHHCDVEAFNATLHPFIRNSVGIMEYGGTFLNKYLNKGNKSGKKRMTSDVFQLATAVLYQNPVQNFALAPNNLTDAPQVCLDYLKAVPTEWDETRLIDGYPGKYVVLARRAGDKWYVAGINATDKELKLKLDTPFLAGKTVQMYSDDKEVLPTVKPIKIKANGRVDMAINPECGVVMVD